MFIVISVLLSILVLFEKYYSKQISGLLFSIFLFILTALLTFRYGQGTDYFGYELSYDGLNPSGSLLINSLYHGELGWYVLMMLFKRLGASFAIFLGFIALTTMIATSIAIVKHSEYPLFSLLILYPTYYLTYYYSGIREGLVFALFLLFGIELLTSKKYSRFIILVVLLGFIHTVSYVLLLLPVYLVYRSKLNRKALWLVILFVIAGYAGLLNRVLLALGAGPYLKVSISIPAIVLRVLLFYIIYTLHKSLEKMDSCDEIEILLYNIYCFGFYVFLVLSFASTLSQRSTMPMKGVELLLIPHQLYLMNKGSLNTYIVKKTKSIKVGSFSIPVVLILIAIVLNVETIKNINSYLQQGDYHENLNVLEYPIITLFNKDALYHYRF